MIFNSTRTTCQTLNFSLCELPRKVYIITYTSTITNVLACHNVFTHITASRFTSSSRIHLNETTINFPLCLCPFYVSFYILNLFQVALSFTLSKFWREWAMCKYPELPLCFDFSRCRCCIAVILKNFTTAREIFRMLGQSKFLKYLYLFLITFNI